MVSHALHALYYFGLPRYLDALDWYGKSIPQEKLGVGIANRNDIEIPDGYVSRFHALEASGADWLNLWAMPVADVWLQYIKRWKAYCAGCPNKGALSCYEPTVNCDVNLQDGAKEEMLGRPLVV